MLGLETVHQPAVGDMFVRQGRAYWVTEIVDLQMDKWHYRAEDLGLIEEEVSNVLVQAG